MVSNWETKLRVVFKGNPLRVGVAGGTGAKVLVIDVQRSEETRGKGGKEWL